MCIGVSLHGEGTVSIGFFWVGGQVRSLGSALIRLKDPYSSERYSNECHKLIGGDDFKEAVLDSINDD